MSKLSYLKLEPFKTYNNKDKLTSEQRFWKKYQNNLIHTYPTTITTISFLTSLLISLLFQSIDVMDYFIIQGDTTITNE